MKDDEKNEGAEPVKAEPKVVPSEAWLAKHLERMRCAVPVPNAKQPSAESTKQGENAKQGETGDGKPPESVTTEKASGKSLGLGDGWGW